MSNEDKRTDEIVEEIMQSIYDDLDNLDKEEERSESSEEFEKPEEETEAERAYRKQSSERNWQLFLAVFLVC